MEGKVFCVYSVAIWSLHSMLCVYQCAVNGKLEVCAASQLVNNTLEQVGCAVHPSKSLWAPMHCLIWLGFVINISLGHIEVPQSKILALQSMLEGARCGVGTQIMVLKRSL